MRRASSGSPRPSQEFLGTTRRIPFRLPRVSVDHEGRERRAILQPLCVGDLSEKPAHTDWHISGSERADLAEASLLLGVSTGELDAAIESAMIGAPPYRVPGDHQLSGKTVCFRGSFTSQVAGKHISRELATNLAQAAGLSVVARVTKELDFLVVADADSQSGKARTARELGIRIIAESAFWQMLGLQVE